MANILKYAFRITHIDNISNIVNSGLVRYKSPLRNEHYVSIGDRQIIQLREELVVKGYHISDYIPFYFGPRSPMLYVIQHGYNGVPRIAPDKIVYCTVRLDDLINNNIDCVFTDGHALSMLTSFYTKDKLPQINTILKYNDIYSSYWNLEQDIDLKRRKEAELLVKEDLPASIICGYVVYNEEAEQTLIKLGISKEKIAVCPGYYF